MQNGNYLIVVTFFTLWISGFLSQSQQQFFAFFLILSIGIIHGAHDIFIIKKMLNEKFKFFRILLQYLILVIAFALLYSYSPTILMTIFVFFSAYHFGEQHWLEKLNKPKALEIIFTLCYGLVILGLLLRINLTETQQIIREMSSFILSKNLINSILILSSAGLVTCSFLLKNSEIKIKSRLVRELTILAVLTIIFFGTSLIWGFAVYFIIWHSVPSILSQLKYTQQEVSWKSFVHYLKKSLVYWLIAITGLIVSFYMVKDENHISLSIFLPFIAALTLPHALIISQMFRHLQK